MIEVYCRCEGDDSNSENLDFFYPRSWIRIN